MKKRYLPAAALLLLGSHSAFATLGPIIITATRTAQTADETLASVTVITRKEIERQQAQSVQDLLRGIPGVSIANNGGPGKATSVFLRGTESDHVLAAIRAHHTDSRPIVAECGGMLYLLESLTDTQGRHATMAGLLPGHATMQDKLANLGLHSIELPEGTLRGHTLHYSCMVDGPTPITHSIAARNHGMAEAIYQPGRLTASYLHFYFPSNPETSARLFLP